MFIELTDETVVEEKQYVNINRIINVRDCETGVMIVFADNVVKYYKESYDEVKRLIENELASERGY